MLMRCSRSMIYGTL